MQPQPPEVQRPVEFRQRRIAEALERTHEDVPDVLYGGLVQDRRLFARDADRRMPPASMAKMMTVYVLSPFYRCLQKLPTAALSCALSSSLYA